MPRRSRRAQRHRGSRRVGDGHGDGGVFVGVSVGWLASAATACVGPVGRSSYALLRQRLKASSMLRTEERLLSLVCNNADDHQPATVHSAGVHSLLIVRRDDGAASSA